jgi:hypothetical protein
VRSQKIRVDAPVYEKQFPPLLVHDRLALGPVPRIETIGVSRMSHSLNLNHKEAQNAQMILRTPCAFCAFFVALNGFLQQFHRSV